MPGHRVFSTPFATVYPIYVEKARRKGRTKEEVDQAISWLTGAAMSPSRHGSSDEPCRTDTFKREKPCTRASSRGSSSTVRPTALMQRQIFLRDFSAIAAPAVRHFPRPAVCPIGLGDEQRACCLSVAGAGGVYGCAPGGKPDDGSQAREMKARVPFAAALRLQPGEALACTAVQLCAGRPDLSCQSAPLGLEQPDMVR